MPNSFAEMFKEDTGEIQNSFGDMIKKNTYEIKSKYSDKLPERLNTCYKSSAELFFRCRNIRNEIYHSGFTKKFIFHFEEGFGIAQDLFGFSEFDIWPQDKIKENNIVSLLALFAYITKAVIKNMNDLALVLLEVYKPQNPLISNDYMILLRGTCTEHLNKLDKYLDEQWF